MIRIFLLFQLLQLCLPLSSPRSSLTFTEPYFWYFDGLQKMQPVSSKNLKLLQTEYVVQGSYILSKTILRLSADFRVFPKIFPKIWWSLSKNFPDLLPVASFCFPGKLVCLTAMKIRMFRWSIFHNRTNKIAGFFIWTFCRAIIDQQETRVLFLSKIRQVNLTGMTKKHKQ